MKLQAAVLPALLALAAGSPVPLPDEHTLLDMFSEPVSGKKLAKRALPFNRIIAFGDDYTDNSQGSYAHGITGDEQTGDGARLWGAGTWTDGPVAVTYMSQYLNMPIAYDYAFGSSLGGQKYGSVCNNSAIPSDQLSSYSYLLNGNIIPDALRQIQNYTNNPTTKSTIGQTLHVLWTGNNDVIASLGWVGRFTLCVNDNLCVPGQQSFIQGLNGCLQQSLLNLIANGAKYILVPDIYPRQITPWTSMWITSNQSYINNYGKVINQVNVNLQTTINALNAKYGANGVRIVYFPSNYLITNGAKNPVSAGIGPGAGGLTAPGYVNTCVDGCTVQGPLAIDNWSLYWNVTIINKGADQFYWMTEVVASTTVHKAIGYWMAYYVNSAKWS